MGLCLLLSFTGWAQSVRTQVAIDKARQHIRGRSFLAAELGLQRAYREASLPREKLQLATVGTELALLTTDWGSAVEMARSTNAFLSEVSLATAVDSTVVGGYLEGLGDMGNILGYAGKSTALRELTRDIWLRSLDLIPSNHPRYPVLHRKLGMLYRILKRSDLAKEHFRQSEKYIAQASIPEQARFHQYYGQFLYKTTPSRNPNDPATLPRLAQARSRLSAAQLLMDRGHPDLLPEDSVIQYYFQADLNQKFYRETPTSIDWLSRAAEIVERQATRTYLQKYVFFLLTNTAEEEGRYIRALNYYRMQENTMLNYPVPPSEYAPIYGGIAYIYKNLQEFNLERIYYQRSYDIYKARFEADSSRTNREKYALILNNMASALRDLRISGEEGPGKYLQDALYHYSVLYSETEPQPVQGKVLHNLGIYQYEEGNFQQSIDYLQRSVEVFEGSPNPNAFFLALNYNSLARSYFQVGEAAAAERALESANGYQNEGMEPIRLAELYTIQGDYQRLKGDWLAMANITNRALWELNGLSNPDNFAEPVALEDLLERQYALTALESRALALKRLAEANDDSQLLELSLQNYRQSIELVHILRQQQSAQTSQVDFSNRNRPIFESALDVAYKLYELTGDTTYCAQAFELVEQSRGMVLLAAVSTSEAATSAMIPEDLLLRQRELQATEDSLLRRLSRSKPAEMMLINKDLVDISEQQEGLRKELQRKYPKYYEQIYETETVRIPRIQADMEESRQNLVEFFYGDSLLFTFGISADTVVFQRERILPAFEANLEATQRVLGERNTPPYANEFARSSHEIYQFLLGDLGLDLPEKLLVIPDNRLNFLSFEALVNDLPATDRPLHFNHLNFLLDDHIVSYDYSYTIRKRRRKFPETRTYEILAMAPAFDSTGMMPLPYAEKSIQEMSGIFDEVDPISGQEATESFFRDHARSYGIIDLATHGQMDSLNSSDCRLYFCADSLNDGMLHLGELYSLDLNARMAILEACESGLGPNARGEGVMSMARGFSYAGCNTIVTSLWNVTDEEMTFSIMTDFYRRLAEGEPVDEALAHAKRDYLAINRDSPGGRSKFYQPFYWAEMIVIGDTSPITIGEKTGTGTTMFWSLLAIGGTILVLVGLRFRQRRRKLMA